ncbi:uncharacterized protein PAE49_003844 [Odontesthes bonariensis]
MISRFGMSGKQEIRDLFKKKNCKNKWKYSISVEKRGGAGREGEGSLKDRLLHSTGPEGPLSIGSLNCCYSGRCLRSDSCVFTFVFLVLLFPLFRGSREDLEMDMKIQSPPPVPPPVPPPPNQPIKISPAPKPQYAAIPYQPGVGPSVQETGCPPGTVHDSQGGPQSTSTVPTLHAEQNAPESPPPDGQQDGLSDDGDKYQPVQETDPAPQALNTSQPPETEEHREHGGEFDSSEEA